MIKDLVTILTPAYNAEHLIFRLLDSVLGQTYNKISMIVVDDGSTDDTAKVIKSYIPKFEARGYNLKIVSQENSGQASAINNGLKYVDGEYLVWPDSDDWYASPEAIEKLVNALKRYGDDVGVARCAYKRVKEEDMSTIRVDYPCMGDQPEYIFYDAVLGNKNFWLEPGGYMIKVKFLDEIIPEREIYHIRLSGQNTQILWPYLFAKKCVSVEEPLFTYLIRKSSHSRGLMNTPSMKLQQKEAYYKTFDAVLHSIHGIGDKQRDELLAKLRMRTCKNCMDICFRAGDFKRFQIYYREIHTIAERTGLSVQLGYKGNIKRVLTHIPFMSKVVLLKNMSKRKILLYLILIASIMINFFVAFILITPTLARKYYEKTYSPVAVNNADSLENVMLSATNKMLNDDIVTDESIMYYKTMGEYIHNIFKRGKLYSVFQYGEFGYFLHFVFLYAENTRNIELSNGIKKCVDHNLFKQNFKISRNDQIAYGCVLIDLYKKYGEQRYKHMADAMFYRLDSINKSDGIVKYRENESKQDVDGIGLICPFLNLYAKTFGSKRAMQISSRMLNEYALHGMDSSTGLPCQAYDVKTNIKLNIANWGRGCGWLCMGMVDADTTNFTKTTKQVLVKMDSTLVSMAPYYKQYLGQYNSHTDMSATVLILYYLYEKGLINFDKKKFANIILPFVDKNGFLRFSSPSIARPNEIPNPFQKHHVAQAISLYLLSLK